MAMTEGQYDFSVTWRPFFLHFEKQKANPDGIPKAPDTPSNPRVGARMKQAGAAVGIDFTGKCDRYPNTVLAHCLLEFAAQKSWTVQNQVAEILFHSYFTAGIYPDIDNLCDMAAQAGLDKNEARKALSNPQLRQEVTQDAIGTMQSGVSGVPYFIMNGKPVFSGAQDPSSFVQAFASASC